MGTLKITLEYFPIPTQEDMMHMTDNRKAMDEVGSTILKMLMRVKKKQA